MKNKLIHIGLIVSTFAVTVYAIQCMASGGSASAVVTMGSLRNLIVCTVTPAGTGNQDVAITDDDVEIASVTPYIKSSILGVISTSIVTDDTSPVTIIGTTLLAGLTGGKNLTPYDSEFFLGQGKKIRMVHVGTASGGTVKIGIEFFRGGGNISCL